MHRKNVVIVLAVLAALGLLWMVGCGGGETTTTTAAPTTETTAVATTDTTAPAGPSGDPIKIGSPEGPAGAVVSVVATAVVSVVGAAVVVVVSPPPQPTIQSSPSAASTATTMTTFFLCIYSPLVLVAATFLLPTCRRSSLTPADNTHNTLIITSLRNPYNIHTDRDYSEPPSRHSNPCSVSRASTAT